jgi:DNA-binding transcriptional regulator YiaG
MTKRKKSKRKSFGGEIIHALKDFNQTLKSGTPFEAKYTVHTYDIPSPKPFTPKEVKTLRHRLSASQALFARLLGVSPVLVEHWERGERTPHPVACRLLELIAKDPAGYMNQYVRRKAG